MASTTDNLFVEDRTPAELDETDHLVESSPVAPSPASRKKKRRPTTSASSASPKLNRIKERLKALRSSAAAQPNSKQQQKKRKKSPRTSVTKPVATIANIRDSKDAAIIDGKNADIDTSNDGNSVPIPTVEPEVVTSDDDDDSPLEMAIPSSNSNVEKPTHGAKRKRHNSTAARPTNDTPVTPVDDEAEDSDSAPEEVPTRKSRSNSQPSELVKAVWVDEDDANTEIDLLAVPRRKKLRRSENDTIVSAGEYASRVSAIHANRAAARGATGDWAALPTKRKSTRGGPDFDSDSSDDIEDDIEHDADNEDDDGLSADVRALLRSSGRRRRNRSNAGVLPAHILECKPVLPANRSDPSQCEASCVAFHPSGRLVMTAGLDKTVRVFSIDGTTNARVQAVHLENFPIRSSCFIRGGDAAVFSSRRSYLRSIDFESGTVSTVRSLCGHEERSWENAVADATGDRVALAGQNGKVVLLSARSMLEMGQLRVNGRVSSMVFAPGQRQHEILTATDDGCIYLWDVRKSECLDRHLDEGAVHTTCLAMSAVHYATGSDSGVVNVYKTDSLRREDVARPIELGTPRTAVPIKRLMNLRTPINYTTFSPDGQILAFGSHAKKGLVRLAHTGAMSVFRNWPSAHSRTGRVCSLTFSPGGGYLAIGTENGIVQMLRIMAYPAC